MLTLPLFDADSEYDGQLIALQPVAGTVFVYSFLVIVFFVLLNILLAILVEAYMKVALLFFPPTFLVVRLSMIFNDTYAETCRIHTQK